MRSSPRARALPPATLVSAASLACAASLAAFTGPSAQAAVRLPACPQVFGHGGYPSGANAWERDQIRQPNSIKALDAYRGWGAAGVEADVQLTKVTPDGGKAVMWHNTSTWGLTGPKKDVTGIYWTAGADRLQGRTVTRGPSKGQKVSTLREWLDHAKSARMIALLEIKPETATFLLRGGADATSKKIKARAWAEITGPVRERYRGQEIMVYSHHAGISAELASRAAAGTFPDVVQKADRPTWVDDPKHPWEEPPPSWTLHQAAWKAALAKGPKRVATTYTADYVKWQKGKCA
ncbi:MULTISPECIES: hypothetical protein [Actinomadura]|uniref:GP-PDE domain-containing protein n=1 Tax=Actinomadura yumaensis TaxID=111807 RepID=A0ABW2CLS2_9ACTN|nr:hypothetical protein [Actinomadura sp. J1-007]